MLRLLFILVLCLPCFGQISLSYLQSAFDETDLSTYTFASQNLGTADPNRKIVVAVYARRGAGSVSSVTVAGVTATEVVQLGTLTDYAAMFIAAVPTGTSGDIVITLSGGTSFRTAYSAWRLVGNSISVTASASDNTSPLTQSVNVAAGGAAIAAAIHEQGTSFTWTNLTENADSAAGTGFTYSAASGAFASAQTPLTVTATPSIGTIGVMLLASFEEAAASSRRVMVIN